MFDYGINSNHMTETVRVEKKFSALTVWGFQED